jgi:hypothetical protein
MYRGSIGVSVCLPMLLSCLLLTGSAAAGPSHQAAMAVVENGQQISDTGNLTAAMAEYDSVEELYPEEYEAILWARFRKAECLTAGGRFGELLPVTEWIYVAIRDGKISNPDAVFWGASTHACSLDRNGQHGWEMAQTANLALDAYAGFADPDLGKKNAAGWLQYWKSKYFYEKEQYEWARTAAEQAWELAKEVKNGTLAAWSRLMIANALTGEGNLLLAHTVYEQCEEGYRPHEGETYRLYLMDGQMKCALDLGLHEDVRAMLMEAFEGQIGGAGLQIRAAQKYIQNCWERGAYEEAIVPLCIVRSSFQYLPVQGEWIERMWVHLRKQLGPQVLAQNLSDIDAAGTLSPAIGAAVKLQLADELVKMGLGEEVMQLCDAADGMCLDPRYAMTTRLLRAAAIEDTTPDAKLTAVDDLLPSCKDDPARASFILAEPRNRFWDQGPEAGGYGAWLDARKDLLPVGVYALDKCRWLREIAGDLEGALAMADLALTPQNSWQRIHAHAEKIVTLYRMDRDDEAEAAIENLFTECPGEAERDFGLYLAGESLCQSIDDKSSSLTDAADRANDPSEKMTLIKEAVAYRKSLGTRAADLFHRVLDRERSGESEVSDELRDRIAGRFITLGLEDEARVQGTILIEKDPDKYHTWTAFLDAMEMGDHDNWERGAR